MPLGWERINAKKPIPNKNIVFIKPCSGPDEATSKEFLERLAAQCLPIMNRNHLAVVSLEEYEPNLEFWGRNFNHGEVVQLVLKSPSTNRWLPFKVVQMVLMHELAHCKEMNHSKAFWKVRNEYVDEMKALWSQGYTGEGLWGRGVLLENGTFASKELGEKESFPEHTCGGAFRSKGRGKRTTTAKITNKEAKERRIKKRFGENGLALGADNDTRLKLEKGKMQAGKPRVAGSARGRELRAAAARARFEAEKEEPQIEKGGDSVIESVTESDFDEDFAMKVELDDAVDIHGKRLLDSKGHGLVKVCEEEDDDDADARRELEELQVIKREADPTSKAQLRFQRLPLSIWSNSVTETEDSRDLPPSKSVDHESSAKETSKPQEGNPSSSLARTNLSTSSIAAPPTAILGTCPVCSVKNDPMDLTCTVCSNVLKPDLVSGSWQCQGPICKDGKYVNAGDVGRCGVCGTRKCF